MFDRPAQGILVFALALDVVMATGCGSSAAIAKVEVEPAAKQAPSTRGTRQVRATGTIEAVYASTIQVPQIAGLQPGQNARMTLVKLAPNGTRVKKGDVLAEFDRTQQIDAAREAKAKFEDLSQQVKQKEAQNKSEAEKRSADVKQAEADLAKAEIQLKKGPVLSEIDRLKNEVTAENARLRVAALQKIDRLRSEAESAGLKILKLQAQRQQVALQRSETNSERMVLKAPLDGMVALENIWRGGSMGNAQEGDQLWSGQSLMKIFNPTQMRVRTLIGEPDTAVLGKETTATVYLDAYPDAVFKAHFDSASPVATSALGSPIKNFTARFRLEALDPRLLPDLSAAVIVDLEAAAIAERKP
ncbi:MAG TPA: HlyD family efflux transporter periplasmic adaptor subunit [Bryobacteraceae bacterium]|nr:HlyD family efflux transporter periplasmic adaptor subunit [Bryobacteraceae bacterium]